MYCIYIHLTCVAYIHVHQSVYIHCVYVRPWLVNGQPASQSLSERLVCISRDILAAVCGGHNVVSCGRHCHQSLHCINAVTATAASQPRPLAPPAAVAAASHYNLPTSYILHRHYHSDSSTKTFIANSQCSKRRKITKYYLQLTFIPTFL